MAIALLDNSPIYATGPSTTCSLEISSKFSNHSKYSETGSKTTFDLLANFSNSPGAHVATLIPHLIIMSSNWLVLSGNWPTS